MSESRKVGVIGLGKMGLPIAGHLVRAGHQVTAFDLDAGARERAAALGAEVRERVRDVAEASDATIVIVGSEQAADEVCADGDEGLLVPGKVVIMCSTVTPEAIKAIAERAAAVGVEVLDAPMARGEPAAEDGTLLIMGAGRREVFDEWKPVLGAFGSDVVHLGEAGAGQLAKSINNYLLWAAIVATYEGMRLGLASGVDMDALREALSMSSGASYAVHTWQMGRDMPWAEKDMKIVLETFEAAGVQAPLSAAVRDGITEVKRVKAQWQGDRRNGSMDEFVRSFGDR